MPRSVSDAWIRGSDVSLQVQMQTALTYPILNISQNQPVYIDPTMDYILPFPTDTTKKLEPTRTVSKTEKTDFTRYVLLFGRPSPTSLLISIIFSGTGHIGYDGGADTGYFYMYAKLSKTTNFSTYTDITSETRILNYSNYISSEPAWIDDGTISGRITASVTLNANEFLVLVIRGTSYCSNGYLNTATGINSTNFKIYPSVFL
jgi:hypothetical protein